ncbi:hypothetical protein EDC01DRAFT_612215 [Geopyxis carbonaria]|nr:hypothetical protein EDC01DRAFT_612215 [Geopyxis carbonaria]
MTSNDRHANHDSPYRSFQSESHRPLSGIGVGRNPPLSSVTSPVDGAPYRDDDNNRSTMALNAGGYGRPSANGAHSPNVPYSPGMRTASTTGGGDGQSGPGGIALQDFGADGMPPAPPVSHTWTRIDAWAEDNFNELFDNLCTPASVNDVNELEYTLDCSLPQEVRESIQVHDGQERGGMPTGIIFGCMLMDCEEIVDEWKNWRVVESEYLGTPKRTSSGDASSSSSAAPIPRTDLQSRQDSQPDGAVQKVYSHPGWIPLARDWGGNYIACDLAPGPTGTWGQIILTGRDYDCKFVVAKSWAHFLAMVADDMQSPHWYVDEESSELKLKDPKAPRSEPSYMEILRVRNERKYGRRRFPRRPGSRPGSKPNSAPGSPHLAATNGHRGGLTRPAKQQDENLSDNHLKIPSKKAAKALRSVSEEPAVPAATHKKAETDSGKDREPNLLDTPIGDSTTNLQALADVKLDDEPKKLKRVSSDLISHPPIAAST